MTTTTVIIKRNADKNYDRLFAALDAATTIGGRINSISEKQTDAGYAVEFPYLPAEVMDFLSSKPKDFDLA